MLREPFYNPKKTYCQNFEDGPFGAFADGKVFVNEGEPQFELFGRKVFSPFGIPAGPLINGKFMKAALDKGFDILVYKTVRTRQRACHPWPNVLPVDIEGDLTIEKAKEKLVVKDEYGEPLSITNSFGNPSYKPDFWQEDIASVVKCAKKEQIVGASFEGTRWEEGNEKKYIDDWILGARLLKETGAHFLEANLSCPNEGTTELLCYDANKVRIIAEAIKNEVGDLPLVLKISYFANDDALADFIAKVGGIVDGIAAINTISAEVVDKEGKQALPGEGRLRSGICGNSIRWVGIDIARRLKNFREKYNFKYVIIGVGGIMNPADFKEYMGAGADAAMSATGAMWNPYLAKEINSARSDFQQLKQNYNS